jgi:hypothetical protein
MRLLIALDVAIGEMLLLWNALLPKPDETKTPILLIVAIWLAWGGWRLMDRYAPPRNEDLYFDVPEEDDAPQEMRRT